MAGKQVRRSAEWWRTTLAKQLSSVTVRRTHLPAKRIKPDAYPTGTRVPFPKAGNVPVAVKIGGRKGRFFGVGFTEGLNTAKEHQLFRMDHEVYGIHFAGYSSNLGYWKDGKYEFHIPR